MYNFIPDFTLTTRDSAFQGLPTVIIYVLLIFANSRYSTFDNDILANSILAGLRVCVSHVHKCYYKRENVYV
jgi:hypothetical protein